MLNKDDLQVITELLRPIYERLDKIDNRLDSIDERLSKVEKDSQTIRATVENLVEWRRTTLLFRLFHFSGKFPKNNK
jgi:archaellum component FlaC